jgi:hypothetical protein
MTGDNSLRVDRRTVLAAAASGAATSLASCGMLEADDDADTADVGDDRARELAERFAPTLRFDSRERWFPNDPRQFESDRDGDTVVGGFDALNGYVEAGGYEDPPEPRVFYNVLEYANSPPTSASSKHGTARSKRRPRTASSRDRLLSRLPLVATAATAPTGVFARGRQRPSWTASWTVISWTRRRSSR